ncbi:MAG: T9SS type A sorting domain-containing protein [Bacteroidales bacterium]
MKKILPLGLGALLSFGSVMAQEEHSDEMYVRDYMSRESVATIDKAKLKTELPKLNLPGHIQEMINYWIDAKESGNNHLLDMLLSPVRYQRVSKAPKDGCFYGIGNTGNTFNPQGISEEECVECEKNGGRVKTNQSYVWGLTKGSDKLIWGTVNNYFCTRLFDRIGGLESGMPVSPTDNSCYVCEFDQAASGKLDSDWHAPRIYSYDINNKKTTDITPPESDEALSRTLGLRSAGSLGKISFVAGPNMDNKVSLFAYDNSPAIPQFLKSWALASLPGFPDRVPYNMRRWSVAKDELYFGVEWKNPKDKTSGGAVLRWKKEKTDDLKNPALNDPSEFFEVVGWTRGGVAEMVTMNNRLYVTTWPSSTLCKSPEITGDKLEPVKDINDTKWQEMFSYSDYDPDLVCGMIGSGGGMAVYKGQIYFGTLNMPLMGAMFAAMQYGIDMKDPKSMLGAVLGTSRGCALFRYTETDESEKGYKIELLYGEEELPAYDMASKSWIKKSTGMTPLYGKSGFNNIMNNYCWSMNVYDDKLYIGTMDWTSSIYPRLEDMLKDNEQGKQILSLIRMLGILSHQIGFDLYRIDGPDQKAKVITRNGLGEETQYGIRNMINLDGKLYLGTANPYNVHEISGWELIEVTEKAPQNAVDLIWDPMPMKYGELLTDDQLNAKVLNKAGEEIPGSYTYTLMYQPVEDIQQLRPGTYNLRVSFMPENKDLYPELTTKKDLIIDKSVLDVNGDTLFMDVTDDIPATYSYKMKGFVFDDTEDVLIQKPTAKASVPTDKTPGSYEIMIQGGQSDYYDFNYRNGLLVIKVPTNLDANVEKAFSLYPIPFKNEIHIEAESAVKRVVITTMTGSEIYRIDNPGTTLNLSKLPSAVYIMSVETENGTIVRKVSKAD